jgi:hypothetical protein
MPKGPQGQKRLADVVSNAILVGRLATGEETEELLGAVDLRAANAKGGKKRAEKLSPERRTEIAREAAKARWQKD